jgi:hypothetical protein
MRVGAGLAGVVAVLSCLATGLAVAQPAGPSRPAFKGCAWERLSDASAGLAAWVQRCDYGFRKIDFFFKDHALMERFSDGGEPAPLIEVFDRREGESAQAAVRRVFAEHTDQALVARCTLARHRGDKAPPGVARYTFVPNPQYARELKKTQKSDEVGDPPCGDWGIAPDGIQYFELRPGDRARKLLFVRIGQDEPLFDEKTLQPIGPR